MDGQSNQNGTRYLVRFSGHVQGVGFRATTLAEARHLHVHGFVRNEPDGSVHLDVEGSPADVQELLRRIKFTMRDFLDDTHCDVVPPLGRNTGLKIQY